MNEQHLPQDPQWYLVSLELLNHVTDSVWHETKCVVVQGILFSVGNSGILTVRRCWGRGPINVSGVGKGVLVPRGPLH